MQFLKHSNRSSVLTFLGEKEAAQSFFVCIYEQRLCFFSTRQVGEVPTKSQLDQVSLIPNSDA